MEHFKKPSTDGARARRQEANEDFSPTSRDLLALAKKIASIRLGRPRFLSAPLLGEPGYDMMLAMFIALGEGRAMREAELALASDVPATTASRWTRALEELALITRKSNPADLNDCSLELTPEGDAQIASHLEGAWHTFQA